MTPGAPPAASADALSPANRTKASYAIGLTFGKQLRDAGLTARTLSLPDMEKGLQAALGGKEIGQEDVEPIKGYINALHTQLADENHAAGKEFLASNAHKPGVTTTASGLQYRVIQQGHGDPPKRTDTVSIKYTGRLLDGTVFDSTEKHGGQPASMPVGGVIPGFTEALELMRPGAKYEVWLPAALAYDMRSPPGIPPGSTLHFEIELLSILPPAPAAGAPGAPGAPGVHPAPAPHPAPQQPPH